MALSALTLLVGWQEGHLVPAHPGSPGKRAVKRVYVCVHLNSGRPNRFKHNKACSHIRTDTRFHLSTVVKIKKNVMLRMLWKHY